MQGPSSEGLSLPDVQTLQGSLEGSDKLPRMKRFLLLLCLPSLCYAQPAPATSTLILSLKTISKALAGCREVYTRKSIGTPKPILQLVLQPDDYDKEMKSLDTAEGITKGLLARPERLNGKLLVAILSTMDDVSVGAGSTRFELLSAVITQGAAVPNSADLVLMSEAVNACQKSLFNAGDDYVDLVMNYVGAEDKSLAMLRKESR